MKVGAHVSTAGGVDKAIDRAQEIGAEAVQFFCSSPQGWAFKPLAEGVVQSFREKALATGIGPNFLHCIYLVNLGTADPAMLQKSVGALMNYMQAAAQLGCAGVIFHGGSHKGAGYEAIFGQTVASLARVLEASPPGPSLCIENSAGMGNHIGSKFEEIGRILKALQSERVKVCMDTQHTFAAGYRITEREGLERAMEEFDREIGLGNLAAVHANDSKPAFASGVDRHENIGEGQMGEQGFEVIMAHPAFRNLPFFLEVPGSEGKGPDKANVDRLKAIRVRVLPK